LHLRKALFLTLQPCAGSGQLSQACTWTLEMLAQRPTPSAGRGVCQGPKAGHKWVEVYVAIPKSFACKEVGIVGRRIADGETADVLRQPDVVAAYLGAS